MERGDSLRNTEAEEHILKLISCGTAGSDGNFCQVFTFSIEGAETRPQLKSLAKGARRGQPGWEGSGEERWMRQLQGNDCERTVYISIRGTKNQCI